MCKSVLGMKKTGCLNGEWHDLILRTWVATKLNDLHDYEGSSRGVSQVTTIDTYGSSTK